MVIAGHTIETDASTQRLGYCYSGRAAFDPKSCAAFVGMRTSVVAAWVLMASRPRVPSQKGRFEVGTVTVWKVETDALLLSQGIRLPYGRRFATNLETSSNPSAARSPRSVLENDSVGATIWVDARSGEVLDAAANGCA